jgi:hypothetical protein
MWSEQRPPLPYRTKAAAISATGSGRCVTCRGRFKVGEKVFMVQFMQGISGQRGLAHPSCSRARPVDAEHRDPASAVERRPTSASPRRNQAADAALRAFRADLTRSSGGYKRGLNRCISVLSTAIRLDRSNPERLLKNWHGDIVNGNGHASRRVGLPNDDYTAIAIERVVHKIRGFGGVVPRLTTWSRHGATTPASGSNRTLLSSRPVPASAPNSASELGRRHRQSVIRSRGIVCERGEGRFLLWQVKHPDSVVVNLETMCCHENTVCERFPNLAVKACFPSHVAAKLWAKSADVRLHTCKACHDYALDTFPDVPSTRAFNEGVRAWST